MNKFYLCAKAENRSRYQTQSFYVEPKDTKAREVLESYFKIVAPRLYSIQDERFNEHLVYRVHKSDLIAFIKHCGRQQDYKIFKRQKAFRLAISADREISQELV